MFARLVLSGSDVDPDGYYVNLPNYSMIAVNYDEMWAVVSFGNRDAPPSLPAQGSELYPLEGSMYVLIGLSEEQVAAWWQRLATRYPSQSPPFMPGFP